MATTVDTLLVRIEADMSDLRRSLNRVEQDIDKSTKGIGKSFKGLGTVIKGAIGVAVISQLGRAGMAAINLASDVAEMQSKSKVVFGEFRDQVVADLTEFGDAVGRSSHELEEMASSIQDTFVPMGFARGEAAKLSVQLSKLAVDVASFNNASDTETMRAFQSALVGNHETVRRFGIVITEAELKQELLRMGIKKTSKDVTAAEKVQARLNLIIAGTTDAQGDAIRTSDSFANRMKKLQAEFETLTVKLGERLLPAANRFLTFLIDATEGLEAFLRAFNLIDDARTLVEQLADAQEKLANLNTTDMLFEQNQGALKMEIALLENEIALLEQRAALREASKEPVIFAGSVTAGDPNAFSEDEEDLLEKNAIIREEIRLQRLLNKARLSGNKDQERLVQREIDALPLRLKLTNLTEDLTDAEKAYTQFKTQSGDATKVLIDTNVKQSETLQQLKDDYDALGDIMEVIHPLYEEQINAVHAMSSSLSDAFADMLMSGKFNLESLKDIFRSFVKTMIAKAIELFVINAILSRIFPGAYMPVGGGGFIPRLPAATGGAAYSKQPVLVGERGPEVFVPHSAGTIMNSNNTRSAMGGRSGTTVVQNINLTTGVQQTVRNEIRTLMPEIAANAKNAVMDSKRRGGNFGRAFA